jgi:hypothetical protein
LKEKEIINIVETIKAKTDLSNVYGLPLCFYRCPSVNTPAFCTYAEKCFGLVAGPPVISVNTDWG